MKTSRIALILSLLTMLIAPAWVVLSAATPQPARHKHKKIEDPKDTVALDDLLRRVAQREKQVLDSLGHYSPRVETYLQNLASDRELGAAPVGDEYFLGRLNTEKRVHEDDLLPKHGAGRHVLEVMTEHVKGLYSVRFQPNGFAALVLDPETFDRRRYDFDFVRREFLGDVRCLVLDVQPREKARVDHFQGRIWVEDQDYTIVRFNGTFAPDLSYSFHLDSWRQNLQPGLWLPVYVYGEESNLKYVPGRPMRFKALTQLWGYEPKKATRQQELTRVLVEAPEPVRDTSEASTDPSPVQRQRQWRTDAEKNVLDRLEKASLIAPTGSLDTVLETTVNNLAVTNHLDNLPTVHCRVLLTSPLESMTVGNTIVLSRGLIDVLPDEASLAMILAHELAHISLGDTLDTRYAFNDRLLLPDEDILIRFNFKHGEDDESAADAKALEFLKNSPYQEKLASAGLFLRAVMAEAPHTPNLFGAHLGGRIAKGDQVQIMAEVMSRAPALQRDRVDQIAALPLGARVKVDPWSGRVELLKSSPVALVSAREKMPFEVTPLFPYLKRINGPAQSLTSERQGGQDPAR